MLYRHQILNGIWAINPDFSANYLPLIASYLTGKPVKFNPSGQEDCLTFAVQSAQKFNVNSSKYNNPENAPEDSVAIISITGTLTKYDQECGPDGILTKSQLLQRCYDNPNIKGIVLNVDSGGGAATAMFLMAETIAKRTKPVVGFVSDNAFSAAYGILSGCDLIIANNKTAGVGSIGTYCTIIDYSEQLKKLGVKLIDVYATDSKHKNSVYREAIKGNIEPLRAEVDRFNDEFLALVEQNRGEKLKKERSVWGTGKTYFADESIELGLIDAIDSFDNILNYF
jgi:ClpP class serine protease